MSQKRKVVEPVAKGEGIHGTTYTHPAYATISASRCSSNPGQVLFGTDFLHGHFVTVAIHKGSLRRNLSQDWVHGGDEYISVEMSEAQWATFVSSMNVGSGTPCTLKHRIGKDDKYEITPEIPYRVSADIFPAEVRETINDALAKIDSAIEAAEVELAGTSAKKREKILSDLRLAKQEIEKNLPYVVDNFGEHMENTIQAAKQEVNAYALDLLHRAGVAALAGGKAPITLGAGETNESQG